MTVQDLSAIGSLIGALAVGDTLIYLAKQIRLNTQALEDARKLALAQTYQMLSDGLQEMLVQAADSEHLGPVIAKLTTFGYAWRRPGGLWGSWPALDLSARVSRAIRCEGLT